MIIKNLTCSNFFKVTKKWSHFILFIKYNIHIFRFLFKNGIKKYGLTSKILNVMGLIGYIVYKYKL